jgi:hypothetical protein
MKSLKNLFKRPQPAPQPDHDARKDKETTGAGRADTPKITPEQVGPSQLRKLLATHFDTEQLRVLCLELNVPYEDLGGEGRAGKALQLVLYLRRRKRLLALIDELARLHPEALQAAAKEAALKKTPQAKPSQRRPDTSQKKRGPVDTPPAQAVPEPAHLTQLTRLLDRHFNLNELRDLCFELRVDYDNLPGATKVVKARELVTYFTQPGRDIAQLVQACAQQRPRVSWRQFDTSAPKSPDASAQVKLRRMLTQHLDESQVRALCVSLEVDYGSLPGTGAKDKARELVLYVARRGRSAELVAACMGLRPDVPWEQALHATKDESPAPRSAPPKVAQFKPSPRVKLSRMISSHFDEVELRDLCFELGQDYDDLAGGGKLSKARELVITFERQGRMFELVRACARQHPDLDW